MQTNISYRTFAITEQIILQLPVCFICQEYKHIPCKRINLIVEKQLVPILVCSTRCEMLAKQCDPYNLVCTHCNSNITVIDKIQNICPHCNKKPNEKLGYLLSCPHCANPMPEFNLIQNFHCIKCKNRPYDKFVEIFIQDPLDIAINQIKDHLDYDTHISPLGLDPETWYDQLHIIDYKNGIVTARYYDSTLFTNMDHYATPG